MFLFLFNSLFSDAHICCGENTTRFLDSTEPKPGSEKDLDPKKIDFELHPWGLSARFFLWNTCEN
jgi:hypothetical protein